MNAAQEFLSDFKFTRNFSEVVPLLVRDAELKTAIFDEIRSKVYPFPEYASWIAVHFFEKHPELMTREEFDTMVSVLRKTKNHSVQRNLTNALVNAPFDCSENGELLDLLIDFLHQPETLPALKHHAFRMIEQHYLPAYPELMRELRTLFEVISSHPKASMQAMSRKFEKKYRKHPYYEQ
ncbi:hypothetical protein [Fluviicola chungangensis]|uniref:HEAT repeat domain-containing protein n=1 Tax=Fluviicola chungangensis TaxID=2597671 RepID=A0A556N7K2_9FLAO|nr:hypothetical protein [Fluviicola chungangensis]TSJ48063.1 hypothetical protein FO442_02715 [Fluviicola chungangensis]